MSAFDPPDSPDLPGPIREFHLARRAWMPAWTDPAAYGSETAARFDAATEAMKAALRSRGGAWTHDRFTYELDHTDGITITQAKAAGGMGEVPGVGPDAEPARAEAGAVPAGTAHPGA